MRYAWQYKPVVWKNKENFTETLKIPEWKQS